MIGEMDRQIPYGKKEASVSLTPCEDYSTQTAFLAMEELLVKSGRLDFVRPGMRIAIKLNLVSAMKAEAAATTHPVLVEWLCRELIRRGAAVVLGDSPGGPYTAVYLKHVYNVTGIREVAERTGAELNEDFDTADLSFPQAKIAKGFTGTAWLTKADAIINFCKLKTHGMMAMSASVKNLFGTIPGTMKPEYHFRFPKMEDFADMLVDLNEYWRPALNIVDAVVGMEGNGPTAGTPRKIGVIMASESPYNMDLVCAKLIGVDESQVLSIDAAKRRGLCAESVSEVPVNDDLSKYMIGDFELLSGRRSLQFGGDGVIGKLTEVVMGELLKSKPKVKKAECIGCKKCMEICPAKAITMTGRGAAKENRNGIPSIDREKCIRCFCCQEFCPKGAMKAHRTWAARWITRS